MACKKKMKRGGSVDRKNCPCYKCGGKTKKVKRMKCGGKVRKR